MPEGKRSKTRFKVFKTLSPIFFAMLIVLTFSQIVQGSLAPDFTLTDIDGNTFSLSDFRDKIVILDFFATWCGKCRTEMSHLKAVYEEFGSTIAIISINSQVWISDERLRQFREDFGITWTVAKDTTNVREMYGVMRTLELFIIDQEGYIRNHHAGVVVDASVLREEILTIMRAPSITVARVWTNKKIYKPGENIVIRAKIKEGGVPKTSGTVYARIFAMGSSGKASYPITLSGGPYITMTLENAAQGKWKGTYGPIPWPGNPLGFQGTYVVMVFIPVPSGPLPTGTTTCFVARTLTESAVAKFLTGISPSRVAMGNNFDVKARIKNPSGSSQTLKVQLILPSGMTAVSGALTRTITLAPGQAKTFKWTLKSTTATNKLVKIRVLKAGTVRAKLFWYIRDP